MRKFRVTMHYDSPTETWGVVSTFSTSDLACEEIERAHRLKSWGLMSFDRISFKADPVIP